MNPPPKVDPGKIYLLTGKTLDALLKRNAKGVEGEIDIAHKPDGTDIIGLAPTSQLISRHPFQPYISGKNANADGVCTSVKITIHHQGTLLETEAWDSAVEIAARDDEFTITDEQAVWMKVVVDADGDFVSATFESGDLTAEIKAAYLRLESDPEDHSQHWWQLLAYLRPLRLDDDDKPRERADARFSGGFRKLISPTTTNLLFGWRCTSDTLERIRACVPWHGAFEEE